LNTETDSGDAGLDERFGAFVRDVLRIGFDRELEERATVNPLVQAGEELAEIRRGEAGRSSTAHVERARLEERAELVEFERKTIEESVEVRA